jgi:hypothetical protein
MRRAMLVPGVLATVLAGVGLRGGGSVAATARTDPCAPAKHRADPPVAAEVARRVASGEALVAADGNRLVAVGAAGREGVALVSTVPGMVRHVAVAPGIGTAYVADRRGPDTVVALTPRGTITLPQPGEATGPTWSMGGDLAWSVGTALHVRPANGGAVRRIPSPVPQGTLFSPVFRSRTAIVAVLSAPPTTAVPEDERLNNLWRYDLAARRWHRLTTFTAGSDRWSAIRTPVRRGDGSLEFVEISGRGSATHPPVFALWSLAGGHAQEVRTLPGERYLAGAAGGDRLWNVPDPRTGRSGIFREDTRGRLTFLGCGSVMTDPLDAVDPDRREGRGRFTPPRGQWPDLDTAVGSSPEPPIEVGILVGDFQDRRQAEAVATRIAAAFGAGAPVSVVDATSTPDAIRPGVFGALLRLDAGTDVVRALADFRARLPEFANESWVVSP